MQPRHIDYLRGCITSLLVGLALVGGCPSPDDAAPSDGASTPSNENTTPTAVLGIQYGPATVESPTDLPGVDVQDLALGSLANRPVDVPLDATGGNGGPAQFEIAALPEFGALGPIVSTGPMSATVRYTPPTDLVGQVAFSYRANVGNAVSRDALVQITIHPEIRFTLSTTQGPSPLTVAMTAFTVQGTPLPEGSYAWRIGEITSEGPVSTHGSRNHVFTRAGQFAIGLTVTIATLSQPIVCRYEADQSTQALVRVDEATVRIRGGVRSSSGAPLAGVPVVSADGAYSALSAANGEYTIVVPQGWSGGIAPAGASQFEPAQRSYSVLQGDVAGQDFAEAAPQPHPPGHLSVSVAATPTSTGVVGGPFTPAAHTFILNNTGGAPLDWTVSGSASWLSVSSLAGPLGADDTVAVTASINTNANSLPPGTYSQQLTFINQTNGAGGGTQSVTLVVQPPPELLLGGRITDAGGTPIGNVTINGLPGNPVTDGNGDYSTVVSYDWSGTATPERAGYAFSPVSRTYTNLTENLPSEDYTAAIASYTISGRVTDVGGAGMSGVTINGLPGNPTTSASGDYSATVNHGWSGTATPSKAGYSFSPASRTYSNVTANQANQGYTAATVTYTISGRAADSGGAGVSGVTIAGLPGNPTTDANGDYSSTVVSGWSGTITPTKAGYNFLPSARTYSNVTSAQSGQNFIASLLSYTISGRVVDGSGIPVDGVQLAGLPGNPTTDPNGNYSVSVTHGWSGTATPTKTDYTFVPASRSYTSIAGAQSGQDYTGTSTGGPQMASSISQYGITWTFDKPYRVGQFVNGDWWVCPAAPGGSVIVQSVSPAPVFGSSDTDQLARNGSCINPLATSALQPYDGRYYASSGNNYSSATSVQFPHALTANQSLVSTVSRPDNDGVRTNVTGDQVSLSKSKLLTAAVLTCLSAPASSMAFRPPYCGTTKPLFDSTQLRRDRLPDVSPPNVGNVHAWGRFYVAIAADKTPAQQMTRYFQRPWIMHIMGDTGENVRPLDNCPGYYSVCHAIESDAYLAVLCNPTSYVFGGSGGSREDMLIALVQYGIDTYYCIQTNPNPPSRGDRCISKWPSIFAGLLLDRPEMWQQLNYRNLAHNYEYFKTDACTYFGTGWTDPTYKPTASTALFHMDPTSSADDPELYKYEHLNPFTVGWCGTFPGNNPYWREDDYRRATHSWTWVGTALAARMMSALDEWDHPAFFAYVDRWMTESETSYFAALQALGNQDPAGPCGDGKYGLLYQQAPPFWLQFVNAMWASYR